MSDDATPERQWMDTGHWLVYYQTDTGLVCGEVHQANKLYEAYLRTARIDGRLATYVDAESAKRAIERYFT